MTGGHVGHVPTLVSMLVLARVRGGNGPRCPTCPPLGQPSGHCWSPRRLGGKKPPAQRARRTQRLPAVFKGGRAGVSRWLGLGDQRVALANRPFGPRCAGGWPWSC
jgi:hypothetical protein